MEKQQVCWQAVFIKILVIATAYLLCALLQNRTYTFFMAITIIGLYVLMILGKVKNAKNN